MGAWIEILEPKALNESTKSLLSWERGLKLSASRKWKAAFPVAPIVGAWIEIVTLW